MGGTETLGKLDRSVTAPSQLHPSHSEFGFLDKENTAEREREGKSDSTILLLHLGTPQPHHSPSPSGVRDGGRKENPVEKAFYGACFSHVFCIKAAPLITKSLCDGFGPKCPSTGKVVKNNHRSNKPKKHIGETRK